MVKNNCEHGRMTHAQIDGMTAKSAAWRKFSDQVADEHLKILFENFADPSSAIQDIVTIYLLVRLENESYL